MGALWSVFSRPLAVLILAGLLGTLPGCGKGKKVPGLNNFNVGVIQGRLYVSFIATSLTWDYGISTSIPGLNNSSVSVAPDLNSAGTVFQVGVGLEDLLNQGKPFPLSGLPDGRKIPDVQGGMLPRWDVPIKNLKLTVYLSDEAFGLFVPIELKNKHGTKLPWLVSVKIVDERGNILGKAYAIPENVSRSGSGLFILLPYLGGAPQSGS